MVQLATSPSLPRKRESARFKKQQQQQQQQQQQNALYLSVNVFSTKVLLGDTILTSPTVDGPPFYVVIRATRRSSQLQGRGSTFISQLS